MKKGTIVPEKKIVRKTLGDVGFDDVTGDTTYMRFKTEIEYNFDARAKDVYILPDHRVRITFDVTGDLHDCDFMIISAKKNGEYFSVGPAHCDASVKTVSFVDYTNVSFLGRVDYYVQPVFETGSVGDKKFIGSAALINSN